MFALLLGQTEEASSVIERSGEETQIDFIRRNSAGSPDLLPGSVYIRKDGCRKRYIRTLKI
jgi:hypothetical protein